MSQTSLFCQLVMAQQMLLPQTFGFTVGYQATNANNSNFFGQGAGAGATVAQNSNFFGQSALRDAINATHQISLV
jgi:uncharacterized membrane protein